MFPTIQARMLHDLFAFFFRLFLVSASTFAFSSLILSSNTLASSPSRFWGTGFPKAFFSMLCRRRSAYLRLWSMVFSISFATERRRSTSTTMQCCSLRGRRGLSPFLLLSGKCAKSQPRSLNGFGNWHAPGRRVANQYAIRPYG